MTGGPAVGMPTSTTFELPGYTVEATLGLSWGLIDHARQLGGNAVLGVRFDSSDLGNGLAEIVAYGTAATVRPA
jgi:uncharacterized protein YbjQ (UPF0145 family)